MNICNQHARIEEYLQRIDLCTQKISIDLQSHLAYSKGLDESINAVTRSKFVSSHRWGSIVSWIALLASVSMSILALYFSR